jgi:SAM-dependent methyltransferase
MLFSFRSFVPIYVEMKKLTPGEPKRRHPAKYSQQLMPALASSLVGCRNVLDPFAGTGRIHELNGWVVNQETGSRRNRVNIGDTSITLELETYGVELEPEWAEMHPRTIQGNALYLPFLNESFDAICTSPVYGNRMSDHHDAKDTSRRNTYTHALGRKLHPDNSGTLQWGEAYRDFHLRAWAESIRVLRPGGRFVLNIKDHIRGGDVMPVTQWHTDALSGLGLVLAAQKQIETPGNRQGENGDLRIPHEWVIVFFRPSNHLFEDLSDALDERPATPGYTQDRRGNIGRRLGGSMPNEFLRPNQDANKRNGK